jgi:hypothetical protein
MLFVVALLAAMVAASRGADTVVDTNKVLDPSGASPAAAAAAAAADSSPSSRLRDLLIQIKNYLDKESTEGAETAKSGGVAPDDVVKEIQLAAGDKGDKKAPNAYEDARTVYAPGTIAQNVLDSLADGSGYWTKWIDADPDQSLGIGEFENCNNIQREQNDEGICLLGCDNPIAASYAYTDPKTKATWTDVESCIGPVDSNYASACGFYCRNDDAKNFPKTSCNTDKCVAYGLGEGCTRCPDVRVQFFCIGEIPDETRCCPYSAQCSAYKKDDLRSSLRAIGDVALRTDVIAGILSDVKDVLEEREEDSPSRK